MLQKLFTHTLLPKTLEQSVGLFMVSTSLIMIWRPYAAALETLNRLYEISISPITLAFLWFLGGIALICFRKLGKKAFLFFFLPCILYSLCLTWSFLFSPTIGPLGSAYSIGFWVTILWMHSKRTAYREQGVEWM